MLWLTRRYAHVTLGVGSVLLVFAVVAWLVERQVDEPWRPALRVAPSIPAVANLAAPLSAAAAPGPLVLSEAEAEPAAIATPVPPAAPLAVPVAPPPPPGPEPAERYVLESGPFGSAEAADRIEDQLNHLGYATVRFRKQEVRRLYTVTVWGFPSVREARQAASELGRGAAVEGEDGVELQVEQSLSFAEAVAAARRVRARGYEVRVDEGLTPTVIYHVRYGQFPNQAAAVARGEELARFGLSSRVVKVK